MQRHRWDLNPGSPVYETGALTNHATAPTWTHGPWEGDSKDQIIKVRVTAQPKRVVLTTVSVVAS